MLRLENKLKEKAFRDAMIASPLGDLYEAASVAEHEGVSEITTDISLKKPSCGDCCPDRS